LQAFKKLEAQEEEKETEGGILQLDITFDDSD